MNIAVVGASNNKEKYGNKVMMNLIGKGHEIFPINPNEKTVEGIKTFKNTDAVKLPLDIIVFVVPPAVTLEILKKTKKHLDAKIRCQPGASDEKVIEFLAKSGRNYVTDSCIMITAKISK